MGEQTTLPTPNLIDQAAVEKAEQLAARDALLEHARLGRSVCESRDGKVVEVTPAEIFARYGLDDYGRPRPEPDPNTPPPDPMLEALLEDREWLDQLRGEGKLDDYRGLYVLAAERQIFGHGRSLVKIRPGAEKKASARGIPPERLLLYFVPGLE